MVTLTVVCAGTNYHRLSGDLLGKLRLELGGREGKDWLFFDGVGTAENGSLNHVDAATGFSLQGKCERILKAVRDSRPITVNLVGWSRGAVLCDMVASRIRCDWDGARAPLLNGFLVDPVLGDPWLNPLVHYRTLRGMAATRKAMGSSFNRITIIRMLDATDFIFQPYDVSGFDYRVKDHRHLTFPGQHGAGVERIGGLDVKTDPVAELVGAICRESLLDWGSSLRNATRPGNAWYCEKYAQLWLGLQVSQCVGYRPAQSMWNDRTERYGERERDKFGFTFSGTVINSHHLICMATLAPKFTTALLNVQHARKAPHEDVQKAARSEFTSSLSRLSETPTLPTYLRAVQQLINCQLLGRQQVKLVS